MQNKSTQPASNVNGVHPDKYLSEQGLSLDIPKRFFSKVNKTAICWLWEGGSHKMIRNHRRGPTIAVSRVSWLIHNGPIPEGKSLINRCPNRNKLCVHPNHWTVSNTYDKATQPDHVPLLKEQIENAQAICAMSGTTLEEIESLRTAAHVTPQWMIDLGFSRNFANRFFAKVKKTDTCWIWTACVNDGGYGYLGINNGTKTIRASRASYMLHKGPIPEGLDVLHNCKPNKDNPACVNPDHLRTDDAEANAEEATEKCWESNRKHWSAQALTEQDVIEIRKLRAQGIGRKELAERFGITRAYVYDIVHGIKWKRAGS